MKNKLLLLFRNMLVASRINNKNNERKIRIGFSDATDTFFLERWDRDIKIFSNVARELGAEVIFPKSPGDAINQIYQIQYLLDQGIDVLVVIPQGMDVLGKAMKKALKKRIPILAYDRPVLKVRITGYVSFDNHHIGRLLAQALVSKMPMGNYLVINGSIHDYNSYEINRGVHEILDPLIMKNDIKIVDEIWLHFWSFAEARQKIRKVFEKTTNIQAISCANDQIAGAALSILAELHLAGKVHVVGQDADLTACQRVVEGLQLMTVYKSLPKLATRAAKIAVSMAKKQPPEPDNYFDNKCGVKIPYYVEIPTAVFKEQMQSTVIEDGFHSKEEVLRNMSSQY